MLGWAGAGSPSVAMQLDEELHGPAESTAHNSISCAAVLQHSSRPIRQPAEVLLLLSFLLQAFVLVAHFSALLSSQMIRGFASKHCIVRHAVQPGFKLRQLQTSTVVYGFGSHASGEVRPLAGMHPGPFLTADLGIRVARFSVLQTMTQRCWRLRNARTCLARPKAPCQGMHQGKPALLHLIDLSQARHLQLYE